MKFYLKHMILSGLIGLTALLCFTVMVDPYDYWGLPRLKHVNEFKPHVSRHQGVVKPKQWKNMNAAVLVIGNSRVQVGFDPQSMGERVYNFGMPGVSLSAQARILKGLDESQLPEKIFLGLDFLDFRVSEKQWLKAHAPSGGSISFWAKAQRLTQIALSLDAAEDALSTVFEQLKRHPRNLRQDGFNPMKDFNAHVSNVGHFGLFAQKENDYLKDLATGPKQVIWPVRGQSSAWRALDEIQQWAKEHDIELILFTYPYHAQLLDAFDQARLWPAFEQWKAELLNRVDRYAVIVWDFSLYTAETMEAVPKKQDRKSYMKWYWEAGHFKAALGEKMMRRMTGEVDDLFGKKLQSEFLAQHLEEERVKINAYRSAHPNDARRIGETLAQFSKSARKSISDAAIE